MFDELFTLPVFITKYEAAPLAEQRKRYLHHLREVGSCRSTLRKWANAQLNLVRILDLQEGDRVSIPRIEAAAAIWARPRGRRCDRAASTKARKQFASSGVQWLRFLGWLDEPERERHPHHAEVTIFEEWMRRERGLSDATIQDYCRAADLFFFWLAERGTSLDAVQMGDIDDAVSAEHRRGAWSRRTIHDYAQRLRAFFLFAEAHGFVSGGSCQRDHWAPVHGRRDRAEGRQARRCCASAGFSSGDRPVDKRDCAILMLFVAYGLRAGEVVGLRLDDLDWENEIIRVRCPKTGRTHVWPLSPDVGNAILRYIREFARPGSGAASFTHRTRPSDRLAERPCAR